jgi:hypothetical protein
VIWERSSKHRTRLGAVIFHSFQTSLVRHRARKKNPQKKEKRKTDMQVIVVLKTPQRFGRDDKRAPAKPL